MPRSLVLAVMGLMLGTALLYAALLAVLWLQQEKLLFFPAPLPQDYPLAGAPDVHELRVPVDGAALSVLHLKQPRPRGVVFFLHGNGGNLGTWFSGLDLYREANLDLVMMDYRGYGKSSGRITSAQQLRSDVRAVWNHVAGAYASQPVVLYGRSLGTGLAADLAAQLSAEGRPPRLTVLASPYFSLRALMGELYPWVPGRLLRYPLDTARHLPHIGGEVLLVHGQQDALIGVRHPMRLQQLLPSARLIVVPQADHNDLHLHGAYQQELRAAFARL